MTEPGNALRAELASIAHRGEPAIAGAVPTLEFWFDFGSTYSYLSVMRIENEAARRGVRVHWRPFLLGPVFRSLGHGSSPFVEQREKGDYVWQDMARQCRKYALPWRRPGTFPRSAVLPSRVALVGADEPWIADYCRRLMTLNFAEDRDIDSPEVVLDVLEALGLPAPRILAAALDDDHRPTLRLQTETARARGVFGAPTFFVGEEMYWGNDRLVDALVDAMRSVPCA